jgi:hypothetical protein
MLRGLESLHQTDNFPGHFGKKMVLISGFINTTGAAFRRPE